MSGPRYSDWMHAHYVGDRDEAAQYLPEARKFLGFVVGEAARNQLQTYQLTRRLPNGTVIIAELRGGQPRVTIVTPGREGREEVAFRPEDFVVYARSDTFVDGIDPDNPEQILRATKAEQSQSIAWRTFFDNDEIPAYAGFGRNKGVYGGQFPDGLNGSGNIDWRGPDGERLSWNGPVARYWCDRWRQPSAMYGVRVFMLGSVLLDVDDYCLDSEVDLSERLVLGACLRGGWLYVMQANIPDMPDPPGAPIGRKNDIYMTQPYAVGAVQLRLLRYRLVVEPTLPATTRYSVLSGSHQTLWTNVAGATVNPWFFSPDGKKLTTMVMPAQAHGRRWYDDTAGDGSTTADYQYDLPSASNQCATLTFAADNTLSLEVVNCSLACAVAPGGWAEALIAVDYDENNQRQELWLRHEAFATPYNYLEYAPGGEVPGTGSPIFIVYVPPWSRFYLRRGETYVPLRTQPGEGNNNEMWTFNLHGLDIRTDTFVLEQQRRDPDWWSFDFHQSTAYWTRGSLQATDQFNTYDWPNGGPPWYTGWMAMVTEAGGSTMSPLSFLFGTLLFGNGGLAEGALPWAWYSVNGIAFNYGYQHPDEAFGATFGYDETGTIADYYVPVASACDPDAPYSNKFDKQGFRHYAATAAYDGVMMFSGPRTSMNDIPPGGADVGISHYVTRSSLPELTGVDGTDVRFHPLWLLGQLPSTSLQ